MDFEPIDLRSDTVTRPDAAMRKAMADAEVGDDVYGEDPTLRALEEEAAEILGFEAGMFVPSGIMGNQIGLRLIAPRGSELLCDTRAHVVLFEMGAMAALSGIQPRVLPSEDGLPSLAAFTAAYAEPGGHRVPTGALELENTHNMAGGRVFPRERIDPILAFARAKGLAVHLDGARIWNAAAALATPPAALTRGFTTVMSCFSKGLGAPVGSILVSDRDRIAEARKIRTMFGGAMRQAGVLAAAARVALRDGRARLMQDHDHARLLARALAENPAIEIDPATVETNIGFFRLRAREGAAPHPALRWCDAARERGVVVSTVDGVNVRFVTHRDVSPAQVARAAELFRTLAA
jgi:threonine aldolase